MKRYKYILFSILLLLLLGSCKSVELSDRGYLDDPDMQFGTDAIGEFQNYVYKIREGATPAGTQKTSGGCGCN